MARAHNATGLPDLRWRRTLIPHSDPELGGILGIRLVNLNDTTNVPAGSDIEVDFDNVRLTVTPVPEPAAFALTLALFGMLVACGRKPRSSARVFP